MYIRSIGIAALIVGILFKNLHWPGASLLIVAGGGLALVITLIRLARRPDPIRLPALLYPAAILTLSGVIFKTLHWPGANLQLLVGMLGCALWFAIPPMRDRMPAQ